MKRRRNKKVVRFHPKRYYTVMVLFCAFLFISIGYAFLDTSLSIAGNIHVTGVGYDIYFDNIQVNNNSVTPVTAAAIQLPTTTIFTVSLSNAGNYYEYTVDVINDADYDAMIDSITILPNLSAAQLEHLTYSVTYEDGAPLALYQRLDSGTSETLKIRISSIDGYAGNIEGQVTIVYVPADGNAIDIRGSGPQVGSGLIPVTISNSGVVTTVSPYDPNWYDYDNKMWANAVLVKDSGVKTRAQNSVVGATIDTSDILGYYVWIPRYSYKIWTTGISNIGSEQSIQIKFVDVDTKEIATGVGQWHTHPAFTFGTQELSGFWIAKFQTNVSTTISLECSSEQCSDADNIINIPESLSTVNSGNIRSAGEYYYAARSMNRSGNAFGLDSSSIDSHMMKNTEFGATMYLAHSVYGINGQIRINNYWSIQYINNNTRNIQTFMTGCGAETTHNFTTGGCYNSFGSGISSYPQSTTGNITGVFDMSGAMPEVTMAYHGDPTTMVSSSNGINSLPDSKYYDNYPASIRDSLSVCTIAMCGGHMLNETYRWYDASYLQSSGDCFFALGSNASMISQRTTTMFSVSHITGYLIKADTFRPILVNVS